MYVIPLYFLNIFGKLNACMFVYEIWIHEFLSGPLSLHKKNENLIDLGYNADSVDIKTNNVYHKNIIRIYHEKFLILLLLHAQQ